MSFSLTFFFPVHCSGMFKAYSMHNLEFNENRDGIERKPLCDNLILRFIVKDRMIDVYCARAIKAPPESEIALKMMMVKYLLDIVPQ